MIGSMMTARAAFAEALKPILAANSKESESESTGWKEPSFKVIFIASTSKPANGPLVIESLNPFSTAGIYSLGTFPPLIKLTNSNPVLPSSAGSMVKTISANLPRPPDCFL